MQISSARLTQVSHNSAGDAFWHCLHLVDDFEAQDCSSKPQAISSSSSAFWAATAQSSLAPHLWRNRSAAAVAVSAQTSFE
jgi:hypothetical protein